MLLKEQVLLIRNFDGKKSLYFFSNKANNSMANLINKFSAFNTFEKTIEEYKLLLKRYKDECEALEREINS